jgi:hypothetical protein
MTMANIRQYRECIEACDKLLATEATPTHERIRIRANADAAREKLGQSV